MKNNKIIILSSDPEDLFLWFENGFKRIQVFKDKSKIYYYEENFMTNTGGMQRLFNEKIPIGTFLKWL